MVVSHMEGLRAYLTGKLFNVRQFPRRLLPLMLISALR